MECFSYKVPEINTGYYTCFLLILMYFLEGTVRLLRGGNQVAWGGGGMQNFF